MKTKLIKTLVLAATFAAAAVARAGNIYEIRPCDENGTALPMPLASVDAPIGAGSNLYFVVRLNNHVAGSTVYKWELAHQDTGNTEGVDWAAARPKIGIYVSGSRKWAELKATKQTATYFTDLIFTYTTATGDFALPIRLATASGPAGEDGNEAASTYIWEPNGAAAWKIVSALDGSEVELSFGDPDTMVSPPDGDPSVDYTLEQAGFYVQTIGFDDRWESADKSVWRYVNEGSTTTSNFVPTVKFAGDSFSAQARTLYIWSKDDTAVRIKGGTPRTGMVHDDGVARDTLVGTLTLPAGVNTAALADYGLELEGVTEGGTTEIVLSAYDHYRYSDLQGRYLKDYVSVPVKCVEPLPPRVQVTCPAESITAGADWETAAATLEVKLTQPVSGDVTVEVTPEFTDGEGEDWADYFRLSTDGTFPATAADNASTVTFAAGESGGQTIYVYALRADEHTALSKVRFVPTASGAGVGELESKLPSAAVNVYADDPVITSPANLSTNAFVYNTPTAVPIAVADNYAAVNDRASGYQIKVVYNATRANSTYLDTDAAWVTLPGYYGVGANNLLFRLEEDADHNLTGNLTTVLPQLTYPFVVNHETLIRVYAPTNLNYGTVRTADTRIVSAVESKSLATAHCDYKTKETATSYPEGTEIGLTVTLEEDTNDRSGTLYAYLRPYGATTNDLEKIDASSAFVVGMTAPQGVQVLPTDTTFELGTVTLKDGSRTSSGYAYTFQVVLSEDANWDGTNETKLVTGYATPIVTLRATNVEPTVSRIEMNGTSSSGNGSAYETKLPLGDTKEFKAILADPGEYDLVNTNSNDLFRTRWTVYLDGAQQGDPKVIDGNPATHTFTNSFGAAGLWQIKCEVRDHDMTDWSEQPYSVVVEVMDQPHVTINELPVLYENDIRSTNVVVGLDYFDPSYTGTVWVAVKVVSNSDAANPGIFRLNTTQAQKWVDQGPEDAPFEVVSTSGGTVTRQAVTGEATNNYYLVSFTRARLSQKINIAELDGVDGGFTLTAYVAYTEDADGPLPTSHELAEHYYLPETKDVTVMNVFPASSNGVSINPLENTISNAWTSAQTIKWSVGSAADVAKDFAEGITISFIGGLSNAGSLTTNITGAASGEFTPIFSQMGPQTITIRIEDKDNGVVERTWYVDLPVAKVLVTAPNGPGGDSAIPLSNTYAKQEGRGEGHVYVEGGTFSRTSTFNTWWELGSSLTKAELYAFGYAAGAIDNGTLNGGKDKWLDATGNRTSEGATKPDSCYQNSDPYRDSYFYGWISSNEPGGTDYSIVVDPQIGTNSFKMGTFSLPSEKTADETGYLQTYVEAVFAREYQREDNMGDIDFDGIPDYFAFKTYANNAQLATPDGSGGELGARNAMNADGDYYPAPNQIGAVRLNGAKNGWAAFGQPFDAYHEIRGYHDGLNYGMFKANSRELLDTRAGWVSDLSLSANEKKALLRRILEERDRLVEKMMKGTNLNPLGADSEVTQWNLITNVLAQIYAKGLVSATPASDDQKMFYFDATTTTNFYEIVDANDPSVTNTFWAWTRTYTPYGAAEAVTVTNVCAYYETPTNETGAAAVTVPANWRPNPMDFITFDELFDQIDLDNWLDITEVNGNRAAQQAATKAYINWTWRHYEFYGAWGWTCENRTDPTIEDTDGDSMPDGFEYYIWYDAVVGTDGTNRLTGCKFNLDDVESYDSLITPEEVANIYNPNIARDWTNQDTDGDGLSDLEEFLMGTNPVHWDSDLDGLSDFYEVYYGMNPLDAGNAEGATMNADGDFMAYVPSIGNYYIYTDRDGKTLWALTEAFPMPTNEVDGVLLTTNVTGFGFQVAAFNGGYIPVTEAVSPGMGSILTKTVAATNGVVAGAVSLYHHQVYNYYGFDPRTAWYVSSANGSLSTTSRWLVSGSPIPGGRPQNTTAYTAINEFRAIKYRQITGQFANDAVYNAPNATLTSKLILGTTNPNTAFENQGWGASETTYTRTQHGADTDGDGVPDGWELYIGVHPNKAFTIAKGSPGYDQLYWDGGTVQPAIGDNSDYDDGLTLLGEYAGTDSCGVYAGCDTIYAQHPSQAGSGHPNWFNKFFPTDPRNPDTDGDGLKDGAEGAVSWSGSYTYNRWGQRAAVTIPTGVKYYAIYGTPSDSSSGSRCIRGGGFNPCTIDTDSDALPDPWERQNAGLLFIGDQVSQTKPYKVFTSGVVPPATFYDDIRAALSGFTNASLSDDEDDEEDEDSNTGYRILLGMDGTNPNDASTVQGLGYPNYDWDGDGLQNWQEYMVQSLRHLRYDDNRMPLMGYDAPMWDSAAGDITSGAWQGANGFPRISTVEPLTSAELERLEELGYPNFVQFVRENPDYLRILGYLADPPRTWDFNGYGNGHSYKYMLPPTTYIDMATEVTDEIQATYDDGTAEYGIWTYDGSADDLYTNFTGNVSYDAATGLWTYPAEDVIGGELVQYSQLVEPYMVPTNGYIHLGRPVASQATYYVGTDPRLWDTDADGMDDYWELYHGLNPLLGTSGGTMAFDVIAQAGWTILRGISPTAWQNGWTGWLNDEQPAFDPIRYPWMMGAPDCDADGDGLRNSEEALMANLTEPNAYHTDPTPLWMTDTTVVPDEVALTTETVVTNYVTDINGLPVYKRVNGVLQKVVESIQTNVNTLATIRLMQSPSYTALYYPNEMDNLLVRPYWWYNSLYTYITSFEENEGYDTDHDWKGDFQEMQSLSRTTTDPLDFTDPDRRQSIYFGGAGAPGVAVSYEPTKRTANAADFFKQFTVEAWIKPETLADGDQYVVSRASYYGGWDLDSVEAVIRMNFALGIDASGRYFAEFENTTDGRTRLQGAPAQAGEWTHVAATYDGALFSIYINGSFVDSLATAMIPATGVGNLLQDPQSVAGFPLEAYTMEPSITILGGRAADAGAFDLALAATNGWDRVATDFFNGRVSEVRTWDGARTAGEILGAYRKRFTTDEIKEMRARVFVAYAAGERRRTGLPTELVQNYSFATLPGAPEAADVATEPTGFSANVVNLARNPDTGNSLGGQVKVGWWGALEGGSLGNTAYTSPYVVPWVQNTVFHLPRLSGTVADSVYWSANYAGYTPASFHDLDAFSFPNTMNPYNVTVAGTAADGFAAEDAYAHQKYARIGSVTSTNQTAVLNANASTGFTRLYIQLYYDLYNSFSGTSDLVPLGTAYARRDTAFWDGQGAESAWAETGTDSDGDGLPDWWEALYGGDVDPDGDSNGLTYAERYLRDLAAGLLPTATGKDDTTSAYASREDKDASGLPDWWEEVYGITSGASGDDDNDGLSNLTEYLLSEIFDLGVKFSPIDAYSVSRAQTGGNRYDTDYFFKIGQLYAGEIFTDHDLMEDAWEDAQGTSYASRYIWDADLGPDEDGWSNFAERRYSQFTSGIIASHVSHVLGNEEMKDMPVPTIRLALRYNGDQSLAAASGASDSSGSGADANTLASIVVQVWSDTGKSHPDATFKIQPNETVENYRYIGMWADRTVRGTLAPGYVDANSINLEFMSVNKNDVYVWRLYDEEFANSALQGGTYEEFLAVLDAYGSYGTIYSTGRGRVELVKSDSTWMPGREVSVTVDDTTENGYICMSGERIGTINLMTGEYSLDLSLLSNHVLSSTNSTQSVAMANSSIRIAYKAALPQLSSNRLNLYLGEATTGFVKEGANVVAAFYDLDGNGAYTVGEPYGTARMDVGWHQGAAEIELTDRGLFTRLTWDGATTVQDGETVADVLSKSNRADVATAIANNVIVPVGSVSGDGASRIRVVRYAVDGYPIYLGSNARVVLDKTFAAGAKGTLTEADFLDDDTFDIDWNDFYSEVVIANGIGQLGAEVTNVTYLVVVGDGPASFTGVGDTNTVVALDHVITRSFDKEWQPPTAMSPGSQASAVYEARPTFKWTMDGNTSYPAFRVQVTNATGTVVWDSGVRRAPSPDLDGVYTFKPDVYVGDGRLEPNVNYGWRVVMYNAKFSPSRTRGVKWSTNEQTFRMNALASATSYGSIKVAVRYFGPDNVLANGDLLVEAFATPDFTGDPVARVRLDADAKAAAASENTAHTANAVLAGLPFGTYYVRAYVDLASYGTTYAKDDYESWGYVCPRDGSSADMFLPTAVTLASIGDSPDVYDLYIEDVDTNGNYLPDAWEVVKNGGTLDSGTNRITDDGGSLVTISDDVRTNLTAVAQTATLQGLADYAFSVVQNAGVAALVLNAQNLTAASSYLAAARSRIAAIASGTTTEATGIDITAILVDENTVQITAEVAATTTQTEGTGGRARLLYAASGVSPSEKTVQGTVYYSYDLQNWTAAEPVTIHIGSDDTATTDEFEIPEACIGQEKCFFRIVVE